jgi:DNA-binding phage protein
MDRIESTGQKAGQEGVIMAAKSKRRKIKVAPYDSADYLKTEADIKNYLEAVFEEPMDRQMLIHTLGVVARARGMIKLEGYRPHPSRTLQSTLSRRKSEFRDRDEDCRRIWYAAEIERLR